MQFNFPAGRHIFLGQLGLTTHFVVDHQLGRKPDRVFEKVENFDLIRHETSHLENAVASIECTTAYLRWPCRRCT
jgi:hypothetical protein